MTDLVIDTKNAETLKGSLDGILALVKDTRKDLTGLRGAVDEKLADASKEAKQFGSKFGDTEAKIAELAQKMADSVGLVAKAEGSVTKINEQIAKHHEAIEKLHAEAQAWKSAQKPDEATLQERKAAKEFFELIAAEKNAASVKSVQVSDDGFESYKAHKAALDKIMRMETSVREEMVYGHLSDAEKKSISTFTHGNRYWLSSELSDRIIACYQLDTDLTGLVSQISTSRGTIEFPVDSYVQSYAKFKCEIDPTPQAALQEPTPGTLAISVHEQYAKECISNTMIEDAIFPVEMWLTQKIGAQFVRGLNNAILNGSGNGMPDGILRAVNHLTMTSGKASGTVSGTFGWQDLQMMAVKLEPRFKQNAVWMFSTNALASLMTMTDGFGRPIFSAAVLNSEGMPLLMGHPLVQVVQLADTLATPPAQGFVPGTTPIFLGDWKQHYVLVVRRGFTALRNPYENPAVGVTWHFSQRVGGGVLCKNAAIGLNIV